MTSLARMAIPSGREMPTPSPVSAPFWTAARDGRLVRQVCGDAHSYFPPQAACPVCLSEDVLWHESDGRGAVYSYTVVHRPPAPGFETPYVVAIVDLDEGWSILSNVSGDPAGVHIGLRVEVRWATAEDGFTIPVFTPEPSEPSEPAEPRNGHRSGSAAS